MTELPPDGHRDLLVALRDRIDVGAAPVGDVVRRGRARRARRRTASVVAAALLVGGSGAGVLLLRGQHSDLLTPAIASEMTRRGPATKFIEFPDCGHAPGLLNHRQIGPVVKWLTQQEA